MARILLLGMCPLPFENTEKTFGPGLRTWQFAKALHDAGHELLVVASRIPFIYHNVPKTQTFQHAPGMTIIQIEQEVLEEGSFLQKVHDDFQPHLLVGATIYPSSRLCRLTTSAPIWVDFFGHVMAEAQAKTYAYNDRQYLIHFWQYVQECLDRGSKFSTVCHRQEFAALGELGVRGRLNEMTVGYEFTANIPCAVEDVAFPASGRHPLRGSVVPADAFVVISTGGFNTWLDADTMYQGVVEAMRQEPSLHFVATGGSITGHDEKTFPHFRALVENGPFPERFHFVGWLKKEEVPDYLGEADLGINIDRNLLEGRLGSRNRFLNWAQFELPFVTTLLSELSEDLHERGLCYGIPLSAPAALSAALLRATRERDSLPAMGRQLRAYCEEAYSITATCAPLVAWAAQSPRRAPDLEVGGLAPLTGDVVYQYSKLASYAARLEGELRKKNDSLRSSSAYITSLEEAYRKLTLFPWRFAASRVRAMILPKKPCLHRPLTPLPSRPKVSVIIVSYNSEAYLRPCLDALFASDYPGEIEVIVVDNDSRDFSVQVVREHYPAERYPNLTLIENLSNKGFAGANNQGLRQASGELLLLLNPDTEINPTAISAFVQGFHRAEAESRPIGIAGCKVLNPDNYTLQHTGGIVHENGLTDHFGAGQPDDGSWEAERDCAYVTGAAMMLHRDLVEFIGVLDEGYFPAYFEELDYCMRANGSGYRVTYLPGPRVLHHESVSTGQLTRRFYTLYHRGRLRYVLMNFPARKLLFGFVPAELRWLRTARPVAQLVPLLRAYLGTLARLPWWLPERWVRYQYDR